MRDEEKGTSVRSEEQSRVSLRTEPQVFLPRAPPSRS